MRLSYRSEENLLRLTLDSDVRVPVDQVTINGFIDIAEQGRLIGVELPSNGIPAQTLFREWNADPVATQYLDIDDDGTYVALSAPRETFASMHVRTAEVEIIAEVDHQRHLIALGIPRRGAGYEISYPSGNR